MEKEWVNWGVVDLAKAAATILDDKKRRLAAIKKIPKEKRTFSNTIEALEQSDYKLADILNKIDFLMYVSPNKEIRDKAESLTIGIRKDLLPLEYDRDIWQAIKAVKNKKETLRSAQKQLLKDYYLSYKRRGLDLPDKEFKRLMKIDEELTELSTVFQKNINEYKDRIIVAPTETSGLPDTYLKTLAKEGENYIVDLSYPNYFPFVKYSDNDKLRKLITEKYYRRASGKNRKLMQKILRLRYEAAKLLGYKNVADYVLELKMAKKSENVTKFIKDLENRLRSGIKADLKLLKEEKQLQKGKKAKLEQHDFSYYARLLEERLYGINAEEIKQHFPFEKVKDGVFSVYSKLFSIKFKKLSLPVWHESVEAYGVFGKRGERIATFYMDMFPREGKYGHAAAFDLIHGKQVGKNYDKPVSALVMNVPEPKSDQPSLLTHSEVGTFFHEFGHVMHQSLTRAPYQSQSGANVARDFVEAPSQMLENWTWNKEVLKMISSNYKTGEPMSDELILKLIASRDFLEPYFTARQLVFATFDMEIHLEEPKSISAVFEKMSRRFIDVPLPQKADFPSSFGHFVGYQAGYYGYLWSKVYAADMFSLFEKEGVLNARIGARYRKEILETGSSREEMESLKAFLGRKPNSKAFLRQLGL